jgi:tRNA threonylcarbamoyl adenosine modification protein YeaZ
MKNVLAISSSTKKTFIALKTDKIEDFCEMEANCKQSENMLYQIDLLLNKHNLDIADIENLAVVVGPGSFTGIRIGVALAKGLSAGNKNIKLYPLSAFDVMASNIDKDKFVCVLNALSGLYFVKEYNRQENTCGDEKMINQEEFNGINIDKIGLKEEDICEENVEITGEALLNEALKAIEDNKGVKPEELKPVYLRNSQAEENLIKNKKTT